MSEYVFSEELEISLIEHRMLQIFNMLDKWGLNFFYPFLIFNESYWRQHYEKRISVLGGDVSEWLDPDSGGLTCFYLDKKYLDLIKSLKILYFSYTRISFPVLLDHLKGFKSKNLSEFSPFGDEKTSPIKIINDYRLRVSDETVNRRNIFDERYILTAKLLALDVYERFSKKSKVDIMFFYNDQSSTFFEEFIKALKMLDKTQESKILKKICLSVVNTNNENEKDKTHFKKVGKSLSGIRGFDTQFLESFNFKSKQKYDFIISKSIFERFPSEILYKGDKNYFLCLGRVIFTGDEKEKNKLLEVDKKKIEDKVFEKLHYEVLFENYSNENVINILEENCNIPSYSYVNFSPKTLSIILDIAGLLKKDGVYYLFDKSINDYARTKFLLKRNVQGYISNQLNVELYNSLLKQIDEIQANSYFQVLEQYLSTNLCGQEDGVFTSDLLFSYLSQNKIEARSFFQIKHYIREDKLDKIVKKLTFFEFLKKKKIPLLGIPSYLYRVGFGKFKKKVLKDPSLKKDISDLNIKFRNRYKDEFLIAWANKTTGYYIENNYVFSLEMNKPFDKDFIESLDKTGVKKDFLSAFIKKSSKDLVDYMKESGEDYLISIQKY